VPVAYIPYFSAPDPTVTRQSGLLSPTFSHGSYSGTGIGVPYFLNLAPNYDLTIAPTYFTSQGPFLDAEWRHRLDNGQYDVRVNGLFQEHPGLFPDYPSGAGNRRWRGSVESAGEFHLNGQVAVGLGHTAMSDPFYLNDYKIRSVSLSQYYLKDVVSSVYLRGQANRGFFDLSGYRFESTSDAADQHQQPFAAPVPRLQQDHRAVARRDRRHWRRDQGRPQRHQYRARRGGLPVDGRQKRSTRPITCTTFARQAARLQGVTGPAGRPARVHTPRPTTACYAASPAITRACPSRSPGSANSSTRSARPGRRSSSPGSMARRRLSTRAARTPTAAAARSTIPANTTTSARTPARPDARWRASASSIAIRSFRPPPSASRFSSRSPN